MNALTIGKIGENTINEDSVIAKNNFIAVSDGAGGGGLYADKWSAYLLSKLPSQQFESFEDLDNWIGDIWEDFYKQYEQEAQKVGGLLLDKFYDEGSFATLVSVYKTSSNAFKWISYGDSVAFCYNCQTKQLQHSFTKLSNFSKPPYLISLTLPLEPQGFCKGEFVADENCKIFCASDTLSHYILMMYYCSDTQKYKSEIDNAINSDTKNINFINTALNLKYDFYSDVLLPLLSSLNNEIDFKNHIQNLISKGLIGIDDYSIAVFN